MTWGLARMARYVRHSKYLQQMKENDQTCSSAFEKASFLMFCKGRPLLTAHPSIPVATKIIWAPFKDVEPICNDIKNTSILLGLDGESDDDIARFACQVNPDVADEVADKFEGRFQDIRFALFTLPDESCQQNVARGHTMMNWLRSTKFCPSCASPLSRNVSGTFLVCSKPCDPKKKHHYPATYPVAISRVTDQSDERVLLVRQPQHPKGMHTCIAGFIEPGEVLEDAVRREIAEEVGIVVEKIKFFQSQTFPIPQNSLMLACTAVAMPGSENLDIDKGELEGAKWFSKSEVKAAFERMAENPALTMKNPDGDLIVPPNGAIAHQLLKNWVAGYMPSHL